MKVIPEETKQEIYQKWKMGLTHKQLSKAYNLKYHQVIQIINKIFNNGIKGQ